jgi:hypothetical protein
MCFIGNPQEHKGYGYLDLASNWIIITRHVLFDESPFPFANISNLLLPPLIFYRNSIAHHNPLALTLLQVPLVPLPLMVLCLRLLPAVPGSSPHRRASILMTSSPSWSR